MPYDVIMPALGMAQETGRLVAWLVQPGGVVTEGSPLLEVETDKSVMEVPADRSGFLAAVYAAAGEDIPVGQVIAVISETKPDAPVQRPVQRSVQVDTLVEPVAVVQPVVPAPLPAPVTVSAPAGRILASPKARRLAAEGGLDFARLVALGVPQPYHVVDLARLSAVPAPAVVPVAVPQMPPALASRVIAPVHHIAAKVPAQGVEAFIDRMREGGGLSIDPAVIWARFAAAGWREATGEAGSLIVAVETMGQDDARLLADPDRSRLSQPVDAPAGAAPAIVLRDLTGTHLTGLLLSPAGVPELTVGRDGAQYTLGFAYGADLVSDAAAIGFMTTFAARLADPLVHLV